LQAVQSPPAQRRPGRPRATGHPTDRYEAKRKAILDAAARLFTLRGYEATSVRDISREAGISQATLYHYTGSKPEILAAIHNLMADELLPRMNGILQSDLSPERKLAEYMRAEMELIERHPTYTAAMRHKRWLLPGAAQEMREKRDEADRILDAILQEGIDKGVFHPFNVKFARLAIMGMSNYIGTWFSPVGPSTIPEIADGFARILLQGLLSASPHR
jgi:AcrR family transcriptional regulator